MSSAAESFPDGVPVTVPESWKKATLGAPVPVIRCTYIFPDTHQRPGEQCKRWSLRGSTVCYRHGGNLPSVRQHAEAVVEAARLRLIESTDDAVDWLIDLGRNSASDAVRLGAAKEVLDRAGVRGGVEVDVTVDQKHDPAEVLRTKIAQVRSRVITGEVVPSDTDDVEVAEPGDTVAESAPTPNEEQQ